MPKRGKKIGKFQQRGHVFCKQSSLLCKTERTKGVKTDEDKLKG